MARSKETNTAELATKELLKPANREFISTVIARYGRDPDLFVYNSGSLVLEAEQILEKAGIEASEIQILAALRAAIRHMQRVNR
jgi:hypothetical protein